ncbi:MAG: hypothetical protein HDT34_02175 [Clostridiales bacterium]|nr:hypothetical protein [Clostridiales bacterium]
MKKLVNILKFCLPVVIYIACSLIAFLLWNLFNYGAAPIISTSIILLVVGSILTGFFTIGKTGKKGMFVAMAAAVIATILWIIAYTTNTSYFAFAATALSSYLFNIHSCLPFEIQEYGLYIGYVISFIAPILLILLGRFIRVKIYKNKA